MKTLIFLKDWLPSVAVVIAGLWVLFRWIVGERQRLAHEIPALDGSLQLGAVSLALDKSVVTLLATWRNVGPRAIHIDTKQTRIDVFTIQADRNFGPLDPRNDLGDPLYRVYPLTSMDGYLLEPHTDSLLTCHFILPPGTVLLFRWKLYRDKELHGGRVFAWTKELTFEVPSSAA